MKVKHYTLRIFKKSIFEYPLFCYYYNDDFGWFRLFGIGLTWKDFSKHGLIFSERYGYTKYLKIGKYVIRLLLK